MKCLNCGKEKQQNEFKWLQNKNSYSVKCMDCSMKRIKTHREIKNSGASKIYRDKI